ALSLAAACGGDRRSDATADSSAVATATTDTASAVAPTDTAAAVTPDTGTRAAGAQDSSTTAPAPTAAPKPAPAPKPAAEPKPAPKPTEPAKPAATPKPASSTGDTAAKAPSQTAQAPAGQAPAAQGTQDAPLRDEYHQAPRDTVAQAVYDGWKQYNLNCARCHGEDVLGSTIAPHLVMSLKPDGPINTKESFVQVVCAGRPDKGMPAWCALGLEMDKIEAIYSYVKGRSAGELGPGRPAVKQGG
ncbi:MAG TPA: c-type cytochrome, partial [Gemmatimonadales bacterium]|nr:c-type cytochrome [Gemmatimonadales bacterium]